MSALKAVIVPVTPFRQNCALAWCAKTKSGVFVDPGGEVDRLIAAVGEFEVKVEKILLTHGHLDHAGGAAELAERLGLPIHGPHRDEDWLLAELPEHAARYGLEGLRACTPDAWFEDGDVVRFGEVSLDVIHCPGHTPGHVVYVDRADRFAFVGDVLFKGSIGRTDFPRGDGPAIVRSIREKLFPLGDDIRFLSGHGPLSTFGEERRANPFVSDAVS